MRKLIIVLALVLVWLIITLNQRSIRSSDSFLRDRIVKLVDAEGSSCTGVEVRTHKNKVYTLTAGHCRALLDADKKMTAIDEQGNRSQVSFVAEDYASDLLLLTSIGHKSVPMAESISAHEKVKAITHGHGLAAFRSDGEVVQTEVVTFAEELIRTEADYIDCMSRSPKTMVYRDTDIFTGASEVLCLVRTTEVIATTFIMPGSSGGPLFNLQGELVGIASAAAAGDPFGRFVRLNDIQYFLEAM